MQDQELLAREFESHRSHLQGVAYRMLGSLPEADDAVQEAWLRLSRSDATSVENLNAWLTTVVARVCLDMLRARQSRREDALEPGERGPVVGRGDGFDAEHETLLAESVGLALLVVLDALPPPERIAFVLHDMFDLSFDEIAPIVGRTSTAARQLASRGRRRVRGAARVPAADLERRRAVVDAYLAASRAGNFEALLAVLDPDVVLRADAVLLPVGAAAEVRGVQGVVERALAYRAGARHAAPALVDGTPGFILAPRGRLRRAIKLEIMNDRIVAIDIIGDPARLASLDVAPLDR